MSLKEDLKDISKSISTPESQLRLQKILTEDQNFESLSSLETHEILKEISSSLAKSLLESKLYHLINNETSFIEEGSQAINRSILDLKGNFIWSDKTCERFFNLPLQELKNLSLFNMISPSSLRYLYSRYSSELLSRNRKIVISYSLTNGIELTSRCSRVIYSSSAGSYSVGVLLETRLCRHRIHFFGHSVALSPIYGTDILLFTPIQITPGSMEHHQFSNTIELENLRITPFLKADSPYKKRKIDECFINEF